MIITLAQKRVSTGPSRLAIATDRGDATSLYLLTPCCGASGKGSMIGNRPAVVCRSCYREVGEDFGWPFKADELVDLAAKLGLELTAEGRQYIAS